MAAGAALPPAFPVSVSRSPPAYRPGPGADGRPGALRIAAALAAAAGSASAAPALVTGVPTWLVATARHDLAPRPSVAAG